MNQLQIVSGTGNVIYDSTQEWPYSGTNQAPVKDVEAGLLLYYDPSGPVKCFVTIYRGRPEQFFAIYEPERVGGDLLQQFKQDVTRAVESDLGLRIETDAGTNQEVFDAIGTTRTTSPNINTSTIREELKEHGTIDFRAPDGERAIQLLRYLHQSVSQQLTIAVSRSQRNPRFDDADVVIILDPSANEVRVTEAVAKRIHERRIRRHKTRLADAVDAVTAEALSATLGPAFDIHVRRAGAPPPGSAALSRYGVGTFLVGSLLGLVVVLARADAYFGEVLGWQLTPAIRQVTSLLATVGAPTTAAAWQVLAGASLLLALTAVTTRPIRRGLFSFLALVTVPLRFVLSGSSQGGSSFGGQTARAGEEVLEHARSLHERTDDQRFLDELRAVLESKGFEMRREEELTRTRRLNTLLGIAGGLAGAVVVVVGLWLFSGVVFETLAANWLWFVNSIVVVAVIAAVLRGGMVLAGVVSAVGRILLGIPPRPADSHTNGPGQHARLNERYTRLKEHGTQTPAEYTDLLWDRGYTGLDVSEAEMRQYQKAFAKVLDFHRKLIADPKARTRIDELLDRKSRPQKSIHSTGRKQRSKRKRKQAKQTSLGNQQGRHAGRNRGNPPSDQGGGEARVENQDDSGRFRYNRNQPPTEAPADQDATDEPEPDDAQTATGSATTDTETSRERRSGPFAMYRGDSRNSGICPNARTIQHQPTVVWETAVDGSITSHPVVFHDRLLVVTDARIQTYVMTNGEFDSELNIPSGVGGSLAVAADTIYVSDRGGGFHAGSVRNDADPPQTHQLERSRLSPPKPFGDHVYVTGVRSLYRVTDTGSDLECIECDLRKEIHSVPAVTDELVLVGTADGELIAHDHDLSRKCAEQIGSRIVTPPAVHDRTAYICDDDETLYRIDIERDRPGWSSETTWEKSLAGTAVEAVGVTTDKVVVGTDEGTVSAYHHDGELAFRCPLSASHVTTAPTISNGMLYVGTNRGEVVALDADTGNERWRIETDGDLATSPVPVREFVFVLTQDGRIQALKTGLK